MNLELIPLFLNFSNITVPAVKKYYSGMKDIVVQITSLCDVSCIIIQDSKA